MEANRKKELNQLYKEMKTEAGVYQIRNKHNGKRLIVATPNLKTQNGRHLELDMGTSKYTKLQADWKVYGREAFVFEVLEIVKKKEEGYFNLKEELGKLEEKWLNKLTADQSYH